MNILDLAVMAILALFMLAGVYKGFVYTAIDILLYAVCVVFAFLMTPLMAFQVEQNEKLFNTMLYYTEGSENIYDVEYIKKDIAEIPNAELEEIYERSEVAFPMNERIRANVTDAAFESMGVTTLGDYFNQTMVLVTINILVFLVLFMALRIVLGFILGYRRGTHKGRACRVPVLHDLSDRFDRAPVRRRKRPCRGQQNGKILLLFEFPFGLYPGRIKGETCI